MTVESDRENTNYEKRCHRLWPVPPAPRQSSISVGRLQIPGVVHSLALDASQTLIVQRGPRKSVPPEGTPRLSFQASRSFMPSIPSVKQPIPLPWYLPVSILPPTPTLVPAGGAGHANGA